MQHRGRRGGAAILLTLASVLIFAACGSSSDSDSGSAATTTASSSSSASGPKVAVVMPCQTSDPWCKQGVEGAEKLKADGVDVKITTGAPQDTAGAGQVLRQYAQGGSDLVIAYSTWQDAVDPVAAKFPKINFATFGSEPSQNVGLFDEPIYQGSYLAGMLAGGITKSKVLSGVAGQDIPLCHAEMEAFKAGAQKIDPKITMLTTYIGDWGDVAKSQQAVLGHIEKKADVSIACGGAQFAGMAQAIKKKDVSGFGYVGSQFEMAPKNIVGSVNYFPYPFMKQMAADVKDGSFQPGKLYKFGMKDGAVKLDLNSDYSVGTIPPDVKTQMEDVQSQIMDGSFEVPYTPGG